ncbi:type II toxin-antitoxin system RelE/ParE family toxin [Kluyvera sichuanensis]|nr:type II toxin-antitoxin system RelE/ParE family toxin [Kluyvera sichuanensis]
MATKQIEWMGTSLDDLIAFPVDVRREAGFELDKVQNGKEPSDWKSINDWGSGVIEIRLHGEDGEYRVVYVAKFDDAVCVLHGFQKKTQKTSPRDVFIITSRYKEAVAQRRRAK